MNASLVQVIEEYRLARGLTPAEASRQIGCSTSQMSRWRRGGGISIEQLQKVADWMGVPRVTLDPLAGYPSPAPVRSEAPPDPRLQAIAAAWPSLDETRRHVLHLVAMDARASQ